MHFEESPRLGFSPLGPRLNHLTCFRAFNWSILNLSYHQSSLHIASMPWLIIVLSFLVFSFFAMLFGVDVRTNPIPKTKINAFDDKTNTWPTMIMSSTRFRRPISGYQQTRQASPTMIKSYDFKCFPLIICMWFQCLFIDR